MQYLRFHYEPKVDSWVIDCPEAPKPAQLWWLENWAKEPKHMNHLLGVITEPETKTRAMLALQNGKIMANILGKKMNGTGDIKLLDVPRKD